MRGVFGIAVILLLAWVLSENRTRVPWRVVTVGVLLQFVLAFGVFAVPAGAGGISGAEPPASMLRQSSMRSTKPPLGR
jgi:concentrative nucleoside transporter, CNT family